MRYEQLASFCEACGKLGHEYKECGRGVYEEKELKFKNWLYAEPPPRNMGGGFNTMRGGRTSRGRGFGRGPGRGIYKSTEEDVEHELYDTGTSPKKPGDVIMAEKNDGARKRLAMEAVAKEDELADPKNQIVPVEKGVEHMSEESDENRCTSLDSKGNKKARTKTNGENQNLELLAGSLEGCRQSQ
jgi:hypothetical protein